MRADPTKVKAVVEWPHPTDRMQLRCFLGFAGFVRRFINGFSQEAAPLNAVTSPSLPFSWTLAAESAFLRLKDLFTTAPVLVHPDPARQFIVEVDASDTEAHRVHPLPIFLLNFLGALNIEPAQQAEPDPGNGPQNRLFVPHAVRP